MMLKDDQISSISDLLQKSIDNLIAIYLFGSAVTDSYSDQSDVDIAFLSDARPDDVSKWDTSGEIASILVRDVDLVDLRTTDTVHQIQIVANGRRIYCTDERAAEAFEHRVFQDYLTLNEDRREILEAVEEDGSVYG